MKTESKHVGLKITAAIAICACLITGGAFAKYVSKANSNDVATVAKWQFNVNDQNATTAAAPGTVSFNLFNTVMEADGTTSETSVAAGKVAPGTGGSFAFKIENKSEVDATYAISLATTNEANVPLEFSTDGGKTWKKSIADVNIASTELKVGAAAQTKTVQWRWPFAGDDTALGIAAQTKAPTVTVTATIDFTQVD